MRQDELPNTSREPEIFHSIARSGATPFLPLSPKGTDRTFFTASAGEIGARLPPVHLRPWDRPFCRETTLQHQKGNSGFVLPGLAATLRSAARTGICCRSRNVNERHVHTGISATCQTFRRRTATDPARGSGCRGGPGAAHALQLVDKLQPASVVTWATVPHPQSHCTGGNDRHCSTQPQRRAAPLPARGEQTRQLYAKRCWAKSRGRPGREAA